MMDAILTYLKSPLPVALLASGAAIGFFALKLRARIVKREPGLRVPKYEKDTVYLFNFPSCRTIVSVSPFGLKLETWIRMHRIKYNVVRKMFVWSRKGQIPFVELNGEEYSESNLIIAKLADHFNISEGLTEEQVGLSRGLEMMLENQTVHSYFYYRYVDAVVDFIKTWEFCGFFMRHILYFKFPGDFRRAVYYHGIGRNTVSEMYNMGCEDILALSKVLGNKQFLFGNQMTTADCYAFGHLAQILYIPIDYPHKKFMREKTPNLCDYVDRIRETLWPDWDQICLENLLGSKD